MGVSQWWWRQDTSTVHACQGPHRWFYPTRLTLMLNTFQSTRLSIDFFLTGQPLVSIYRSTVRNFTQRNLKFAHSTSHWGVIHLFFNHFLVKQRLPSYSSTAVKKLFSFDAFWSNRESQTWVSCRTATFLKQHLHVIVAHCLITVCLFSLTFLQTEAANALLLGSRVSNFECRNVSECVAEEDLFQQTLLLTGGRLKQRVSSLCKQIFLPSWNKLKPEAALKGKTWI